MAEKYYVGLDLGTNSVGWAVTDERYRILRKKGKDMWGARLFDEADSAAGRRTVRVARRRLERQKARIGYLKKVFAPYLSEVDPGFLQRLEDSRFFEEDKTEKQKYALFSDKDFTDKDYLKEYKTIFHLRSELLRSKEPHDIRLVFLAVLNIFNHRGHFLNQSLKEGTLGDISEWMKALDENLSTLYQDQDWQVAINIEEQERTLSSKELTATAKLEKLLSIVGIEKKVKANKPLIEIYKLICGLKGTLAVAFAGEITDEENLKFSISFRDSSYEENERKAEDLLGETAFETFKILKEIHDWGVLSSIMKGDKKTYSYISFAKVDIYKKHGKDLKILKRVIKKYKAADYNHLFRSMEDNTYSAYVGSVNYKNRKIRRGAKSDAFIPGIKKIVEEIYKSNSDSDCEYILNEISKDNFLPKLLTTANGVIPNQLYAAELRKILDNASEYLPFLNEISEDKNGLSIKEQLIALFKFQIPYYVGPLKRSENGNAWVVRKNAGTVYPWNIDDMVDMPATSEEFIKNLINDCTYIDGEKVLPRNSLLFEKYKVLNELNNLKVNEQKISVELKQDIFINLFRKNGKKVTNKSLLSFLKSRGVIEAEATDDCLSGYDKELGGFTGTLSNYEKFKQIFDTEVLTDRQSEIAEDVIYYSTVYGDSRSYLKEILSEKYGDVFDKKQLDRLVGIKFKDWATVSKEFLQLQAPEKTSGEAVTIISALWNTNMNLMQIINAPEYGFADELAEKRKKLSKTLTEITYEDIEDSYMNAPVRRMVWQTIRILQEIVGIMGSEPEKVFVEMARSEGQKGREGRKDSRKKKLMALYKNCRDDEKHLAAEIANRDEKDFRIKKLYLFYLQRGKCMYSGRPIDPEKLLDDNYYDIDHIYPRHYVKDDSLDNNLVLVEYKYNRDKDDRLLGEDIRMKMKDEWKDLHDRGFINNTKYARLMRREAFTDEEFATFIERQMVETGQGTREVTRILGEALGNTGENHKVIFVKAGLVSQFRKYNADAGCPAFVKSRIINDHHHAKDAYLNIVVGNVYYTKFTMNPINYIKELRNKKNPTKNDNYHMDIEKLFDRLTERNGYVAWNPDEDRMVVRRMMEKNSPIITKRTYVNHGPISKLNPISPKEFGKAGGKSYLPLKTSDQRLINTERYGGYSDVKGAYFFLVEHTVKKKRIRTIEPVYVYMTEKMSGKKHLEEYCREQLGYTDPDVRLEKILMNSLLKVNGFNLYLTARTGNSLAVCNAEQLTLDMAKAAYTKTIAKAIEEKASEEYLRKMHGKSAAVITRENNLELYEALCDKHNKGIYSIKPTSIGAVIEKGKESFKVLDLVDQVYVLNQILIATQLLNNGVDLSLIGGSSSVGKTRINKNITGNREIKLIDQSVTGLYEREIDLLTI